MDGAKMLADSPLLIGGEIILNGIVGDEFDGFDARGVREALAMNGGGAVTVRLNSPGGDAFEGAAIMAAFKERPGRVTLHIEGVAASAASLIAVGADEIVMGPGALMMIHDPRGVTMGPAAEHRRTAESLDKIADTYAAAYAERSGRDPAEVRELMLAETWMTGPEAVEMGFADRAADADAPAAPPAAASMLSKFRRTPPELIARAARDGGPHAAAERKEADMPETETAAAATAAPNLAGADAARVNEIKMIAGKLGIPDAKAEQLAESGATVEEARRTMLDLWAASGDPHEYGARPAEPVHGPARRAAMSDKLAAWMRGEDPRSGGAMTPSMIAQEVCVSAGLRPWDAAEAIRMAGSHTTSDFPLILENAVSNEVGRRIEQRLPDLARLSREIPRDDYRAGNLLGLSAASKPEKVGEGGEIKHVTMDETGEPLPTIDDHAALYRVSHKALVNDSTALRMMGQTTDKLAEGAIERLRSELIRPLEANSGAGQTMRDGLPAFHTSRGNIAPSGSALSVTALSAARQAMRGQTGPQGELYNVEPFAILVHPANETVAQQLVTEITPVTADGSNPFAGRLQVVVEPGLSDSTAWYLVADPARFDGLAHSFLDGQRAPRIESREGWNTLGTEWRLVWPLGAGFVAAYSWYLNPGA